MRPQFYMRIYYIQYMYNKKSFENLLKQLSNKRLVMLLPIHTPVAQIKKKK